MNQSTLALLAGIGVFALGYILRKSIGSPFGLTLMGTLMIIFGIAMVGRDFFEKRSIHKVFVLSKSWDYAQSRVLPMLATDEYIRQYQQFLHESLIQEQFAGLPYIFAVDFPTESVLVREQHLQSWGITREMLKEQALKNLRTIMALSWVREDIKDDERLGRIGSVSPIPVHIASAQDKKHEQYVASTILLNQDLAQILQGRGAADYYFVIAPSRTYLFAMPLINQKNQKTSAEILLDVGEEMKRKYREKYGADSWRYLLDNRVYVVSKNRVQSIINEMWTSTD